jgi:hypothetical protein
MDDFVKREEFENLKEKVLKMQEELTENKKLLQQIDKKIDIIGEKIISADKIEELKFKPLESKLNKVESNQDWLWKTVLGSILALAIKIIFDITK